MNGADGSNIFSDETSKIWTAVGNAQIDTDQSVFSGASARFDGTGDYLTSPDSDEFYLNGDFTIDMRVRFNALPETGRSEVFFSQATDSYNWQYIGVENSNGTYRFIIRVRYGGADTVLILQPTTLSTNT